MDNNGTYLTRQVVPQQQVYTSQVVVQFFQVAMAIAALVGSVAVSTQAVVGAVRSIRGEREEESF